MSIALPPRGGLVGVRIVEVRLMGPLFRRSMILGARPGLVLLILWIILIRKQSVRNTILCLLRDC